MSLKKNLSRLFQSLFGLAEFDDRDIEVCLTISLIISLLITFAGGLHEFLSGNENLVGNSLATIEHFSNALPFSILLSLTGLVIYDRIREAIIMRSDKRKQEIENRGEQKTHKQYQEWVENNNIQIPEGVKPLWETQGNKSDSESNEDD